VRFYSLLLSALISASCVQVCSAQQLFDRLNIGPTVGLQIIEHAPLNLTGSTPTSIVTASVGFQSKRTSFGLTAEASLSSRLSLLFSPSYRRLGYLSTSSVLRTDGQPSALFVTTSRTNSWSFPVLGRYYFSNRTHRVRPFAGVGYAWQVGRSHAITTSALLTTPVFSSLPNAFDLDGPSSNGAVVDGGLSIGSGRIRILPEIRYTHWRNIPSESSNPVKANQTEILLTVTF
jgi:hypothetical protein